MYSDDPAIVDDLSTHDLTRRSTIDLLPFTGVGKLSTHDLTRRSTGSIPEPILIYILSTHDLTRRSTLDKTPLRSTLLPSTHVLTRRSKISAHISNKLQSTFQLTTSHGGRLV